MHLILVAGKPGETGGYLWFDDAVVTEGMIVEKRGGIWGAYEVDVELSSVDDKKRVHEEEGIYGVFVEGAGGDEEQAWKTYEAFRERQKEREREAAIFQVFLDGAGGDEDEAREMYEAFCEHQRRQKQAREGGGEEDEEDEEEEDEEEEEEFTDEEEEEEFTDEEEEEEPEEITLIDVSEPSDDLIDLMEQPDVYDCLGEWAMRFDLDNRPSATDGN